MNVGIVGSRTFTDYQKLKDWCDANLTPIDVIVSGGANGADALGARYAEERGLKTLIFKPDWAKHGRGAGFVRNKTIVDNSDILVACWDGQSRGTANSIKLAQKKGIEIFYIME